MTHAVRKLAAGAACLLLAGPALAQSTSQAPPPVRMEWGPAPAGRTQGRLQPALRSQV